MRVLGAGQLLRLSLYAAWLALTSLLPSFVLGIGPFAVAAALGLVFLAARGSGGLRRAILRAHHASVSKRLTRAGKIALRVSEPSSNPLVSLLVALVGFVAPLFAAAYAVKHPGVGPEAFMLAALLGSSVLVGRFVLRNEDLSVVLGNDGVAVGGEFMPYASITAIESPSPSTGEDMTSVRLERNDGAVTMLVVPAGIAGALAGAIRHRMQPSSELGAEGGGDGAAGYRDFGQSTAELSATLRDGAQPREVRVRVATQLAPKAPQEIDRALTETADEELARELERLRR